MTTALLDRTGPPAAIESRPAPTTVAVQTWPHHAGREDLPVLTVVLGPPQVTDARLLLLLDLVDDRRGTGRAATLSGDVVWTAVRGAPSMVRLAIRAQHPSQHVLDLVLPVEPLRDQLRRLARGGTITLTTSQHANRVRPRLAGHVLVPCPPSTVLAGLAGAVGHVEYARTG